MPWQMQLPAMKTPAQSARAQGRDRVTKSANDDFVGAQRAKHLAGAFVQKIEIEIVI